MARFKAFTKKQLDILQSKPAKIEIYHGPVRTGKTIVAGARLYQNMAIAVQHEKRLAISAAAKNIPNCHRNIASSLRDVLGERLVPHKGEGSDLFAFKVHDGEQMRSVTSRCLGWATVHAENGLYGWNIDGSVIDEVVMAPESLFDVNITRLDRPWARLICTTNPQGSKHWLKKNFIDKADGVFIKEYAWKHSDNPHLSQEYLDMLKQTLHGVYYRRLVLGEWCSADGMIYPFLNESYVMKSTPCPNGYVVGFDFGLNHKTAAVLVAYNPTCNPPAWVEDEFVRESGDGEVLTLNDIVMDFWQWLGGRQPEAIYVDPSALVLKNELYRNKRGISVLDADNDVTNGIHCVMSMVAGREVGIGANCERLLDEMYNYCWDSKKSDLTGRDVPTKENDDLCDALRYALYTHWGNECEVSRHRPVHAHNSSLLPKRNRQHDLQPDWGAPSGVFNPYMR
jgi:PBSX family phage terminase large subunit